MVEQSPATQGISLYIVLIGNQTSDKPFFAKLIVFYSFLVRIMTKKSLIVLPIIYFKNKNIYLHEYSLITLFNIIKK